MRLNQESRLLIQEIVAPPAKPSGRSLVDRLKENYGGPIIVSMVMLWGAGGSEVIKDPNCYGSEEGGVYCIGDAVTIPEIPIKYDPINRDEREGMILNRNRS